MAKKGLMLALALGHKKPPARDDHDEDDMGEEDGDLGDEAGGIHNSPHGKKLLQAMHDFMTKVGQPSDRKKRVGY